MEIEIANVHTTSHVSGASVPPFLYSPLSKSPALAGKLHREWTKMAGLRVGACGVSSTVTDWGAWG